MLTNPRLRSNELAEHRGPLVRHCRRILGSTFDAEDAVQEALERAWRKLDTFQGRSSTRTWLTRIATNVCYDMLRARKRHASATDLGSESPMGAQLADPRMPDPGDVAADNEQVRQAFVTALRQLSPRQRAVLILHDVLRWRAREVAELLATSPAAVNSALQRGRAALTACGSSASDPSTLDSNERAQLTRYVAAFEHDDVASLVSLFQAEADAG